MFEDGRVIEFMLNAVAVRTAADPGTLLVTVLRDELRLTGTKIGCDDGRCGTCMVLVNGRVARACRTTAGEVAGSAVVTIEGLGTPEKLHPIQQAFVETGAVECGFCTPGMIMAAKALLDAEPRPTRSRIAKALGANYCRCTGYVTIFEAVERAATLLRGEVVPPPALPLGESWNEIEMATGRAIYAADIQKEGVLHLKVVRSPHRHARVLAVDAAEALALAGVEAVLTAADVPVNRHGRVIQDEAVLAGDRVRMVGDPVAAVVAISEDVAEAGAARVRVQYEALPAVTSPREALEPGAIRVHDGGNVLARQAVRRGDVESGLAGAAVTVEGTFNTPFNAHAQIEPEAALAYVDEDGRIVIHTATSHTHLHRLEVSRALGLPPERVHIVPELMGGHFGGRTDVSMQCILGVAAMRLCRPVRCVYTREESFTSTTKRHAFEMHGRLGADRNGRMTGLRLDMVADTGAYASAGQFIIVRAAVSGCGPYEIPNVWLGGPAVYTNNTLAGAMRGFGAPQSTFAVESLVDELARRLEIHPIELRLRNALRPGALLPTGVPVGDEVAFVETLEAIRPHYDEAVSRARRAPSDGRVRHGVGVASMWFGIGTTTGERPSHADVALLPSGRVAVLVGVTDAGQGSDFLLRRVAADTLDMPLEQVDLVRGDTDLTRDTGSCTGSRVCFYVGNAVHIAAGALRRAILEAAAHEMEVPPETLDLRGGDVVAREAPGHPLALVELAERLGLRGVRLREGGTFEPNTSPLDPVTGRGRPYATYATATHMAEVDVDLDRGTVRVRRVVAVHDVGRVLNPVGARGQVEGAVVMGIGFALKEEFEPGVTHGFAQYQIPTTHDVPDIETIFIERRNAGGPFGSKGLGECALIPTAPAILNAVAEATGVRVTQLPATPCRVLEALAAAGVAR
jgi:CO/xanthine dehydrogenase Mo-binding subunit/aerobic-type carbon monoxide dehydrogenase small subunit (CoxS/CutS family)